MIFKEVRNIEAWEETQKKKEYLNGYRDAKRRERRVEEQIQELRMDKMFPSIQYSDMPHGSNMTDYSDYAAKVDELLDELGKEKLEAIRQYEKIYKAVRELEDEREKDVLTYRYLQGLDWESVAIAMDICWQHAHKIHGKALKNFEIKEAV